MKKQYVIGIFIGFLLILSAVPFDFFYGDTILKCSNGIPTDHYIIILEKIITSFQIIGGVIFGISGLALILASKKDKLKFRYYSGMC